MKKQLTLPFTVAAALILLIMVLISSNQYANAQKNSHDTVPVKGKDFDDIIKDLDKAKLELEQIKDIKALIPTFDAEKLKADLEKSMKDIDVEKMKKEITEAMAQIKQVDTEKMLLEMKSSLSSVEMEKMKTEIAAALKNIDTVKMNIELKELAAVDMAKVKEEMEKIRTTDFAKIEQEMKQLKPELEKSLQNARVEIEKAKEEIADYKNFTEELSKDGLIDKSGKYSVEHKEGQLIINGKVQPADVYNKYSNFLQKHKKFTIKKDDGLNIYLD